MKVFQYVVLNAQGKEIKGTIEADSPRHARQLLREQSSVPISVTEVDASYALNRSFGARLSTMVSSLFSANKDKASIQVSRFKVANKDLVVLTRQISTLMSAGLGLEEILKGLSEEQKHSGTKQMLIAIRARVLEGHSLSFALSEFPRSFSKVYRASVEAGEQAGELASVLKRLADLTEANYQMKQKINQAMIYPTAMLTVSMGIVAFLMIVVVPRLIDTFAGQNAVLPLATRILIVITDLFSVYGLHTLLVLLLLVALLSQLLKYSRFQFVFDSILLKLPIIGSLVRQINTARFSRTLGILYGSGAPIMASLRAATAVVHSLPIKARVELAVKQVKEGAHLSKALKNTDDFSSLTVQLIASGESSGQLEDMLARAAQNEEQDIQFLINKCLALFEPLLIIVMGGIALFICLAIFLPIFELTNFVGI